MQRSLDTGHKSFLCPETTGHQYVQYVEIIKYICCFKVDVIPIP